MSKKLQTDAKAGATGGGKRGAAEAAEGAAVETPAAKLDDGRCPVGCTTYDPVQKCPCGEGHTLGMNQHVVVHLDGQHWVGLCAFDDLLQQRRDERG